MDTEKLFDNFQKYSTLLKKYFPESGTDDFLEKFSVRLTTCPRGLTPQEGGEHGGLIEHALKTAIIASSHTKLYNETSQSDIDRASVTRICLVHEIGKLGTAEEELYVVQESQWHREKLGQNFKYNENCPKMTASHRTLFLLQEHGMNITQDEWLSILTSQGLHFPENSFYGNCIPAVGKILHFAKSMVDLENI